MDDEENASESGTYVLDEKTERQTKVKMDSLERRLRANEKARKEMEEELEKWKSRALVSPTGGQTALPPVQSDFPLFLLWIL